MNCAGFPLPNEDKLGILIQNPRGGEGAILEQKYVSVSRRREGRGPSSSGRKPAHKGGKRRRSPVKTVFWGFYKGLVVLSFLIVAAYIGWNLTIQAPSIPEGPAGGETAAPVIAVSGESQEPGVRARREGVYNFVLLGKDVDSGNTDTIIMVSYDVPNQKIGMVSIPRDTAVERSGWNPKINGIFSSSGADALKETIQTTFGIPIDYYIFVNLKGFVALVDELGGVDVDIPVNMNYDDPFQNLHIHFTKGYQHLDGQAAMEAARYRHDNDNADGTPGPNQDYTDVGRAAMQRQILMALAKKVISWNSLTRVTGFLDIFQTYVETDLSAKDMLYFATQAVQVDLDSGIVQGTLEGDGSAVVKGIKWCFVYEAEDILPVLNETVNPYDEPLTQEDLNLPVSEGVS